VTLSAMLLIGSLYLRVIIAQEYVNGTQDDTWGVWLFSAGTTVPAGELTDDIIERTIFYDVLDYIGNSPEEVYDFGWGPIEPTTGQEDTTLAEVIQGLSAIDDFGFIANPGDDASNFDTGKGGYFLGGFDPNQSCVIVADGITATGVLGPSGATNETEAEEAINGYEIFIFEDAELSGMTVTLNNSLGHSITFSIADLQVNPPTAYGADDTLIAIDLDSMTEFDGTFIETIRIQDDGITSASTFGDTTLEIDAIAVRKSVIVSSPYQPAPQRLWSTNSSGLEEIHDFSIGSPVYLKTADDYVGSPLVPGKYRIWLFNGNIVPSNGMLIPSDFGIPVVAPIEVTTTADGRFAIVKIWDIPLDPLLICHNFTIVLDQLEIGIGPDAKTAPNIGIWMDGTDYRDDLYTAIPTPPSFHVILVDDLSIVNIEPIQVVWDAKALVVNKASVMCVNITSTFEERVWVEINIAYNFGIELYLETGPYGNGIPIDPGLNNIYIPGGPAFPAHPEPWISSNQPPWLYWTQVGLDQEIKAIVDPFNNIVEANEDNNEAVTEMKIAESEPLKILSVPVYFPLLLQGPFNPSTDAQSEFILATYPVANTKFNWVQSPSIPWPGVPPFPSDPENILEQLLLVTWLYSKVALPISVMARTLGYDKAVVIIRDRTQGWAGIAIGMPFGDRVPVIVVNKYVSPRYEDLVAHEIGHTYDLWHPHDNGPHVYHATRFWVFKRDYEQMASTFMSYSHILPPGIPPDIRWIDKGRYDSDNTWNATAKVWQRNLFDQLKMGIDPEIIVVRGTVFKNFTIAADEPWYRLPEGIPDLAPETTGNYSIVLLDEQHQTLSQMNFNVSFTYTVDLNGTLIEAETDYVPFIYNIQYVSGTSTIEIRNSTGYVLASKTISSNPPTVNLTFPNGGEVLETGTNYTMTWEASDPDEDSLTYSLAYSRDGGENWIPIALDLNQTKYTWDTSNLHRGDSYLVKVIATDGVNTAEDASNSTFTFLAPEIAVTDVVPSKTVVGQGYSVSINVTVENYGDFTGIFNVSVFYDETIIILPDGKNHTTTTLPSGSSTILTFLWNTTGVVKSNYTITAKATQLPTETDTTDNTLTDGWIIVTILGDVNGDFEVDVFDKVIVGAAFGATYNATDGMYWHQPPDFTGPCLYCPHNPNADINGDLTIDVFDKVIVGYHFGETYP